MSNFGGKHWSARKTDPFQSTSTDCYHSVYERDGNATYDTERNMLGAVLIAAVLSLVTCSTPVLAQKMSCEQFCRAHCSGAAINKNYCMSRCVAKCTANRSGGK